MIVFVLIDQGALFNDGFGAVEVVGLSYRCGDRQLGFRRAALGGGPHVEHPDHAELAGQEPGNLFDDAVGLDIEAALDEGNGIDQQRVGEVGDNHDRIARVDLRATRDDRLHRVVVDAHPDCRRDRGQLFAGRFPAFFCRIGGDVALDVDAHLLFGSGRDVDIGI